MSKMKKKIIKASLTTIECSVVKSKKDSRKYIISLKSATFFTL